MAGILEKIHNYIIWQRIKKQNLDKNRNKALTEWVNSGRQSPPPHVLKQEVIREFQKEYSIKILVETGTYRGEMVYAQRNYFEKLISIELSEELYDIARKRLKDIKNINLIRGDSAQILVDLIKEIDQPAIFWLDGHYSGFETAKGDLETPVSRELEIILGSHLNHILLIDDARMFNGENDYPEIRQLKDIVNSKKKNYQIAVEDDIIRIYPDFRGA